MATSLFFLMWEDHMDKSAAWKELFSLFMALQDPRIELFEIQLGVGKGSYYQKTKRESKEGREERKERRKEEKEGKKKKEPLSHQNLERLLYLS